MDNTIQMPEQLREILSPRSMPHWSAEDTFNAFFGVEIAVLIVAGRKDRKDQDPRIVSPNLTLPADFS